MLLKAAPREVVIALACSSLTSIKLPKALWTFNFGLDNTCLVAYGNKEFSFILSVNCSIFKFK